MPKDSRLIFSSNLINGLGYFIFTSLFLILLVNEGFNTIIYSEIYASSLLIEAVIIFFNPRIVGRIGLKFTAVLFYILLGFGIFLSAAFSELPVIWVGYVLFIVGGSGWAPIATIVNKISKGDFFTKNLINLVSIGIRIGYLIGGILTFIGLLLNDNLRLILIVSSLIVVASSLPLLFLKEYTTTEKSISIGMKSILRALGYGTMSQLTFILVPLLPLYLYDKGIFVYFIPLFLLFRYLGIIFIGRFVSTKFDRNKNFVLLIQFFLLLSGLLFLFSYWYIILIALFFIGVGGLNHNFYFSIYDANENHEISSSSAFSIGVLISSSLLILVGGYVYQISSLLLLVVLVITLLISLIVTYSMIRNDENKHTTIAN